MSDVSTRGDRRRQPAASVEQVLAATSLFWLLAANQRFFVGLLQGHDLAAPASWGYLLTLATALLALHFMLLAALANRWTIKPLLAVLLPAAAAASYFSDEFGIVVDPSMLRNVLHTDIAEARELLSPALALHVLLYGLLPLALLLPLRIVRLPWPRALARRLALLALALAVVVGAVWSVFQPLSSAMRGDKALRYLITPGNVMWSLAVALGRDVAGAAGPPEAIGLDAKPAPSWAAQTKPRLVVLVVGETARAANWGLNRKASGYGRDTTPELARLPLVSFADVASCGTSTEVSLPCMFAPVGRRNYDEDRIRGQESLLQVLQRAGVQVLWRDNQSGCKGVCSGIVYEHVKAFDSPGQCRDGHCLDAGLLAGLDQRLAHLQGSQLLVLHMLGSHGPSYFRRYPPAFDVFQPACRSDDLQRCSVPGIVNAYDNALRYTDHVLAALIERLQAHAGSVDSMVWFVSDHGESLGEHGLFLHGMPYAIAPAEQKQVPMFMWFSAGMADSMRLDVDCLRRRAMAPASHDNLFHTMLALLDVRTALAEPALDLTAGCRDGRAG